NRHLPSYEISSQQGETIVLSLSIAILDGYVLAFDVARFGQGAEKCRDIRRHRSWRSGIKKPNHRHRRLLRARRKRPRGGRAADQRDELAPPDGLSPRPMDHGSSVAGQELHRGKSGLLMSLRVKAEKLDLAAPDFCKTVVFLKFAR